MVGFCHGGNVPEGRDDDNDNNDKNDNNDDGSGDDKVHNYDNDKNYEKKTNNNNYDAGGANLKKSNRLITVKLQFCQKNATFCSFSPSCRN